MRCGPGSAMARSRARGELSARRRRGETHAEPGAERDEIESLDPASRAEPWPLDRRSVTPMRASSSVEDRVGAVVEDHDRDVELFARHRPERLDRVQSGAVGLERDTGRSGHATAAPTATGSPWPIAPPVRREPVVPGSPRGVGGQGQRPTSAPRRRRSRLRAGSRRSPGRPSRR